MRSLDDSKKKQNVFLMSATFPFYPNIFSLAFYHNLLVYNIYSPMQKNSYFLSNYEDILGYIEIC